MLRLTVGLLALPALWAARETVLLDTDSGQFGDDGAALVMLVRSPSQVSLAGVTIVPGNVWPRQGAEYTLHILGLLQQPRIGVYTGAETPLLHTPAMARQAAKRWGKLEFSGAFDEDPTELNSSFPARSTRILLN